MKYTSVPLVGGYYADESRAWSSQDVVNWLPTQAEKAGTRTPSMLKTPPGLREFVLTPAHPLTIAGSIPAARIYDTGTYQYIESGGVLPYGDITIPVGSLPTGATMDATGLVTYDYSAAGTFNWTLSGADADGTITTHPDSIIISSEILTTWATLLAGDSSNCLSVAVANGIILACFATKIVYSSDNGVTWLTATGGLPPGSPIYCAEFNGDWYLFGNSSTAAQAIGSSFSFATMANGPYATPLTATVLTSSAYPNGALYVGAYGTTNSSIIRMNVPGDAWTTIDTGFAYGRVIGMCQSQSKYFIICNSGKILVSTDLATFTLLYDTADLNIFQCAYLYATNVLVVTNSGGGVYRSDDLGSTWTYNVNMDVSYVTATREEFLGGRLYDIRKSTDGITWTSIHYSTAGTQLHSNIATDGSVAAIGRMSGYIDVGTP